MRICKDSPTKNHYQWLVIKAIKDRLKAFARSLDHFDHSAILPVGVMIP